MSFGESRPMKFTFHTFSLSFDCPDVSVSLCLSLPLPVLFCSFNIFNLVSIAFQLAESQVSTDGLKITPKWAASKEFIRLGLYRKRFV